MRLSISPFRSATFRLALLAVPLYLLAGWALLGFVYSNTLSIMERRIDVGLDAERKRLTAAIQTDRHRPPAGEVQARIAAERGSTRLYLLKSADGETIAANVEIGRHSIPALDAFADIPVRRIPEGQEILARVTALSLPQGLTLVLGRDLAEETAFRQMIEETLAVAAVLMVLLALFAGLVNSRAVLHRLSGVNATSWRLLHGNLDERVPTSGSDDEFDHLADNINEALDRIAELMQATRQVTDNIAHDLRSPLARMRNRLELCLLQGNSRDALEEAVSETIEDTDRLLETFEALLAIARLQHGVPPDLELVHLGDLTTDLIDYYQPVAEDKGQSLQFSGDPDISVMADRHLLFQALSNIVDNAIRYTQAGGHVAVHLRRCGGTAEILVADDGPGIPADQRDTVLQPFVRLDASRHSPGNGLGLAVVQAVARHLHAQLGLAENNPGLRVSLRLPLAPTIDISRT
jgi:signal transduction histidine kinase